MGYHRAGFDVVGVDINPQPHYPFEFIQADALETLRRRDVGEWYWSEFDAIHASPPCQAYSIATNAAKFNKSHPDLVAAVRDLLEATGLPWVIENVPRAPLRTTVELCGASFGLTATDLDSTPLVLRRHRLFESNVMILQPACHCGHYKRRGIGIGGVYGGGPENRSNADRHFDGGYTPPQSVRRELMGIDWMTGQELNNAVPPAYTEFIGAQLIRHLAVTT
jgi:DNA (cytosine-5)-methyltransferase 1